MNWSVNQNRQFYVATAAATGASAAVKKAAVVGGNPGTFYVGTDKSGGKFVLISNATKEPLTSDIINLKNVVSAHVTDAADMATKLKSYKVLLNSNVNGGDVVVSQDYILRVEFKQGAGFSDEDTYIKDIAVRTTSAMETSAALFYTKLAATAFVNFKRLYSPLIDILVHCTAGTKTIGRVANVNGDLHVYDTTGTELTNNGEIAGADYLLFNEKSQAARWALGTNPFQTVDFSVIPGRIYVEGVEEIWGTVTDNTATYATSVDNGYKTADLEYFCAGEKGDQYRNVGWPKVIPTKYLVDPTAKYSYLDIQYYYSGPGEDSMKSPKHLTIVATEANKAVLKTIAITGMGFTLGTDITQSANSHILD